MDEDVFNAMPLEFCDYITVTIPHILDDLSPYIFGVIGEKDEGFLKMAVD